jgi:AmpD protein
MSRISFPGRKVVIQQVQGALGLLADGDDRVKTWQAIAAALPLSPVPPLPASSSVAFPGRDELVKRVQRALGGILVDGDDGQETWAALAERFDPQLRQVEHKPTPQLPDAIAGRFPQRTVLSPNRNSGGNKLQGVVIHHASGYYEGTVSWCLNPKAKVSYHCLINTDGARTQIVPDEDRAWHAGVYSWKGSSGCNGFTLGLAFIGNTNDGAMRGAAGRDLSAAEVASAIEWLRPRMAKYGWSKDDITAHRIIAPGRKDDTSIRALNQIFAGL